MSYTNNIPQSTDLISNSQPQILGNFAAIDSGTTGTGIGFARNHVTMTDGTNGGLHDKVDFYEALSNPTISGFVASIFPKLISANVEACYSNSTGVITQITSGALPIWKGGTPGGTGVVTATIASSGSLNLPNGLQFRWGSGNVSGGASNISFGSAFSTNCFSVVISGTADTSRTFTLSNSPSPSTTGFRVLSSASNNNLVYYFAIGN